MIFSKNLWLIFDKGYNLQFHLKFHSFFDLWGTPLLEGWAMLNNAIRVHEMMQSSVGSGHKGRGIKFVFVFNQLTNFI